MEPSMIVCRCMFALSVCLTLVAGCAGVHQRQAVYPKGNDDRPLSSRGSELRSGRFRGPVVDLRVEPELPSTASEKAQD
jgi:hypothetical protein